MFGSASERAAVVTASARTLPALTYSIVRHGTEVDLHLADEQISQRGPPAAIGNLHHVDAGQHLEQFPAHVTDTPDATRRHAELARIRLGVGDKLRNCCGRNRWVYDHDVGPDKNAGDRGDVTDEMEIQFVVERHVDRLCRTDH